MVQLAALAAIILGPGELLAQNVAGPAATGAALPEVSPIPPRLVEAVRRVHDAHGRTTPERAAVRDLAMRARLVRRELARVGGAPSASEDEAATALLKRVDDLEIRLDTVEAAMQGGPGDSALPAKLRSFLEACRAIVEDPDLARRAGRARALAGRLQRNASGSSAGAGADPVPTVEFTREIQP